MKKMQRRGKLEKDGSSKKGNGKDSKNGSVDGSTNKGANGGGGSSGGGKSGVSGKENFEGTESVASHEDQFVDSDDDDELVFDPMDDVATSDEHSETGGSSGANIHNNSIPLASSHHSLQAPPAGVVGPDVAHALDLRGLQAMPAMHPMSSHGNHSSMHHPSFHLPHNPTALHPVPPSVESLHSANPIDKLYLMQDSYFTQM